MRDPATRTRAIASRRVAKGVNGSDSISEWHDSQAHCEGPGDLQSDPQLAVGLLPRPRDGFLGRSGLLAFLKGGPMGSGGVPAQPSRLLRPGGPPRLAPRPPLA